MIDSDSARRDESNDMCFEAGRCFVPEIASASAHAQTKTPISRRDLNQSMRR